MTMASGSNRASTGARPLPSALPMSRKAATAVSSPCAARAATFLAVFPVSGTRVPSGRAR